MSPDSNSYQSSREYAKLLEGNLEQNYKDMSADPLMNDKVNKPVWLGLAYHSLFNTYTAQQSVDLHQDLHDNYIHAHPIASFNFGSHGGILTLTAGKKSKTTALYQEIGDISIMGGECQKFVKHGVPALAEWEDLLGDSKITGLSKFDRDCIRQDIKKWKQHSNVAQSAERMQAERWLRINSTLRWFAVHSEHCPWDRDGQHLNPAEQRVHRQVPQAVEVIQAPGAAATSVVKQNVNFTAEGFFQSSSSADRAGASARLTTTKKSPMLREKRDAATQADNVDICGPGLAHAVTPDGLKINVYTRVLVTMDFFPDLVVRKYHWEQLEHLLKEVEEEGQRVAHAQEVCNKHNNVMCSNILRDKGSQASRVIQSIFLLKKLLNQELDDFESNGLQNILFEKTAAGKISKLGSNKAMHTKILMTHEMMKEVSKCVDFAALEEHGHLVWDLTGWKDPSIELQSWKREPKDNNVGYFGLTTLTIIPANTKLYVHAIDFGYDDDEAVKRTNFRTDVVLNACKKLGPKAVAEHLQRVCVMACKILRAMDTQQKHVRDLGQGSSVDSRYQIPVWVSRYSGGADPKKLFTSLDEGYASRSKQNRERNEAQGSHECHGPRKRRKLE
jgi:hypothetical protein